MSDRDGVYPEDFKKELTDLVVERADLVATLEGSIE